MIKAAKKIFNMGSKNVLLKGGHLKNKMICDILATKKGIKVFFQKEKLKQKTLMELVVLIFRISHMFISKEKYSLNHVKFLLRYVDKAIASAPNYGKGFGPLNHLVSFNLRNINV